MARVRASTSICLLLAAALPSCSAQPAPAATPIHDPIHDPIHETVHETVHEDGRVVAIGDLHADLPQALAVLKMAGVVDATGHWAGGETILVQTGDTTDRGPDSKEVLELLMQLQPEARAAGGQVIALLGNHEVMNLRGDWRYVSPGDIADFGSAEARQAALQPTAALGAWLRQRDVVANVGGDIFVHGGVSARFARMGIETLNSTARAAIDVAQPAPILGEEGPLWYRAYLLADESIACAEVEEALSALGARRMVMGHTTQSSGRIASRCGGRLLGIDTGVSSHYGGRLAAIELRDGDARALYPTGPVDLPDPPPPAIPAHSGR